MLHNYRRNIQHILQSSTFKDHVVFHHAEVLNAKRFSVSNKLSQVKAHGETCCNRWIYYNHATWDATVATVQKLNMAITDLMQLRRVDKCVYSWRDTAHYRMGLYLYQRFACFWLYFLKGRIFFGLQEKFTFAYLCLPVFFPRPISPENTRNFINFSHSPPEKSG